MVKRGQSGTALTLAALAKALRWYSARGHDVTGVVLHHDRDSVFTSDTWVSTVLRQGLRLSYALEGAKDNTEMESFNSRFKTENRSLLVEAADLTELRRVVAARLVYYNHRRRHSALGNVSPLAFLADYAARR